MITPPTHLLKKSWCQEQCTDRAIHHSHFGEVKTVDQEEPWWSDEQYVILLLVSYEHFWTKYLSRLSSFAWIPSREMAVSKQVDRDGSCRRNLIFINKLKMMGIYYQPKSTFPITFALRELGFAPNPRLSSLAWFLKCLPSSSIQIPMECECSAPNQPSDPQCDPTTRSCVFWKLSTICRSIIAFISLALLSKPTEDPGWSFDEGRLRLSQNT